MGEINRIEGRRAFGLDPLGYDRSRPVYPPGIYQLLEGRCGLRQGARVFEIGPGTGLATKRLLELGADPLLVVEPDERLHVAVGLSRIVSSRSLICSPSTLSFRASP
jgi:hypothetical protein